MPSKGNGLQDPKIVGLSNPCYTTFMTSIDLHHHHSHCGHHSHSAL